MAVTMREVSERAGVSRSAVSRTFTDGASVSTKMRQKVEKAAKELGYHPNALASSLTTGRTKMIGFVSNNFHNPIFLEIFALFTRGLQDAGLRPLLVNLSDEIEPANSVRMLRQYSVDGVIVASSTLPSRFSAAFKNAGMPTVNSFGKIVKDTKVNVVGIDNVESGRLAAKTLIERGYIRIGFMGGPENATSTQDRLEGFASELEQHPEIEFTHSHADHYSFEAGRKEMQSLLNNNPAEAYFCGDDVLSIGALSAIEEVGLNVPEDIGIIGLNDMEISSWENINLTTIHQPISLIVEASIQRMVEMLKTEGHEPMAMIFPCKVIERGTLKPYLS